jgi:ribosomal protein L6P/L9E
MIKKSIFLQKSTTVSFLNSEKKSFLILGLKDNDAKKKFICISEGVDVVKISDCLELISNNLSLLESLRKIIEMNQKEINVIYKKRLRLKGLGYKISLDSGKNVLTTKLGTSHFIEKKIPGDIKVFNNKNFLILEGSNKINVGRTASQVKHLRKKDSYKGKGFSYKYERSKLKDIKKGK